MTEKLHVSPVMLEETTLPAGSLIRVLFDEDSSLEVIVDVDNVSGRLAGDVQRFEAKPQRQGIGTRLFQAMIVELQKRKVEELWSASVTAEALALRIKLLGKNVMTYYDLTSKGEQLLLPLTDEQAIQSRKLFDEFFSQSPEEELEAFGVMVNLADIDSSSWLGPDVFFERGTFDALAVEKT